MVLYVLFVLSGSFALTATMSMTSPPPTPPPTTPVAACQDDGIIYRIGQRIPDSDPCTICHCQKYEWEDAPSKHCMVMDHLAAACYNPVDHGPNACPRYTCTGI
ncbi:uncharacterized protein LOC121389478 [Gigantopelta aegis]|uniref:uncharacterized protein LOC121389478 n=1 Tax=Gigantopelta aegis TaxID=1735272 RepID=UPI001B88CC6F|nr:uncharacterized protein LOC121389478 [Gigantopelta aegis]